MIKKRIKQKKVVHKSSKQVETIKPDLTRLASLKEIRFETLDGKKRKIKFDKNKWELIWNPIQKYLLVVPCKDLKTVKLTNENEYKHFPAYKMWKMFTSFKNDKAFIYKPYKNKMFNKIGKGIHVIYHSDKWNEGDFWDYIHEFGEGVDHIVIKNHGVNVYYDPINKIYKMSGGKLDVTERGIIN